MPSLFNFTTIDNVDNLDDFVQEIDEKVPKLIKKHRGTGVAIALIKDFKIQSLKTYGFANKDSQMEIESNKTYFLLASTSKTMATWGVMKLWENDSIELDKPVNDYLTHFQLKSDVYDVSEITVEKLLSHSAGINDGAFLGYVDETDIPSIEEVLEDVEVVNVPGSSWSYSNFGFGILQLLIEEISQMNYVDYMEQNIFQPMGINLKANWNVDIRNDTASNYNHFGSDGPDFLMPISAAGGHYGTLENMANYALAYMNTNNSQPGKGVLNSTTLDLMLSPVLDIDNHTKMGLGHFLQTTSKGDTYAYHYGDVTGFHVMFGVIPATGEGIVILTNADTGRNIRMEISNSWEKLHDLIPTAGENRIQILDDIVIIELILFALVQIIVRERRLKKDVYLKSKFTKIFRVINVTNAILAIVIPVVVLLGRGIVTWLPFPGSIWVIILLQFNLLLPVMFNFAYNKSSKI